MVDYSRYFNLYQSNRILYYFNNSSGNYCAEFSLMNIKGLDILLILISHVIPIFLWYQMET